MLKADFAPDKEVLADWDAINAALNDSGIPRGSNECNRLDDALLRNNFDEVADIFINEIWSKPLATYIAWSSDLENVNYRELLSRPDVAAAKAARDEEYELARAEVQKMLLTPDWSR